MQIENERGQRRKNHSSKKIKEKMQRHRDEGRSHIEKSPIILSLGANEVLGKMNEIMRDLGAIRISRKKGPLGKPLIASDLKARKCAM